MSIRNYAAITDLDELRTTIDRVYGDIFGFDIETGYTGDDREKGAVHPETAMVVGFSFTNSTDWARYVPLAHDTGENITDHRAVAELLWTLLSTGLGVAHNAAFELRHLSRWFLALLGDHPVHGEAVRRTGGYFPIRSDTQVEAYLVAEVERFGLKSLTSLLFDRLGNPVPSDQLRHRAAKLAELTKAFRTSDEPDLRAYLAARFDGHLMCELYELFTNLAMNRRKYLRFNTLEISPQVVEYACEDSVWCLAIHRRYYELVKDRLLYKVEMAVVESCLPPMEDHGVLYDWATMRRTAEELRLFRDKFNAEIMIELSELTGETIALNLASPPQISNVLFTKLGYRTTVYTDKTRDLPQDERKMSTGSIALTKLAQQYPVVKKILQWKEMTRLLGTYLDKYEAAYGYADDGRCHPSHLSAFVVTGRFAVADPPYQQCLPGSYQVLTHQGWVRLDELDDTTRVAQYHEDGDLEFVVPDEVVRNDYTGDMIHLRGGEIGTWAYTPNHRIVYRTRDRKDGGLSEVKEATAEQWHTSLISSGNVGRYRLDRQHITAGWQRHGVHLTEDERNELRLAVAIQADGTRTNGHQYDIAVHRERKVVALREMGLEPEQQSRGRWRVRIPRARLDRWLDETKNFKAEAILTLSQGDLGYFIDEIMQWDGDSTRGATYTQSNARAASVDVVQAAAALCGYTTSLYFRTEFDATTVNLHDSTNKGSGWQEPAVLGNRDGKVYCVTVPTGMFLCRNDQGNVMVTGNSPKKYHFDLAAARTAHAAGEEPPPGTCFKFNFRDCIIAPPEHYGLGFDLSQAELRAIAGEAQETALLRAFEQGEDVHRLTASLMLGVPLDEITGEQRDIGKTMNFALLYGMGVKSLADRLGIPIEEAQSLMDKYFAGYANIATWSARQVEHGKRHGYVTSRFGRRLPIWEYHSDKHYIRQKGDRACVNYPIQGAATGDYMKIAMVRAQAAIKAAGLTDKIHLVMNIHDALEFYVHTSVEPQDAIAVLKDAVVFAVPGWPAMKADWHLFKKWGSPMEIEIRDDGSLSVKGEKVYELAPSVEVDEETGEKVEAMPEVDPAALHRAAASAADEPEHRQVIVTLTDMPVGDAWRTFVHLARTTSGGYAVTVSTPEGDVDLPFTSGIGPDDLAAISRALGSEVTVTFAATEADTAAMLAGMQW